MKTIQMNDNLIDIVFWDCDKAISNISENIESTYVFNNRELKITVKACEWDYYGTDDLNYIPPPYTYEQMKEVYIYVISELKQLAIREIRSGISDNVLTFEAILSNPSYRKSLDYSIVKYDSEFSMYINVKLI